MSIQVRPRVVSDSMLCCLDAANPKSYSGSTWNDLSGNSSTVAFGNAPTFDAANGGSFLFVNSSSQYADITIPNLNTNGLLTVEMWLRCNVVVNGMFLGFEAYAVYPWNGSLGYNTANADVYGISPAAVTANSLIGNWKHYVFTMGVGQNIPTTNKIHINGIPQQLSQILGSTASSNAAATATNTMRINGWLANTQYLNNQNVSVVRVYNRALTDAEIVQNFEATRGRFNI